MDCSLLLSNGLVGHSGWRHHENPRPGKFSPIHSSMSVIGDPCFNVIVTLTGDGLDLPSGGHLRSRLDHQRSGGKTRQGRHGSLFVRWLKHFRRHCRVSTDNVSPLPVLSMSTIALQPAFTLAPVDAGQWHCHRCQVRWRWLLGVAAFHDAYPGLPFDSRLQVENDERHGSCHAPALHCLCRCHSWIHLWLVRLFHQNINTNRHCHISERLHQCQ